MMTREDPAKVAPDAYKVILENDRVRVIELTLHPGDNIPMHDHPDMVAYPLTDVENTWTYPDGSQEDVMLRKGVALWHDAFSHAASNAGDEDEKILVVELKR
jgi:beta-alanine degradation protein BauB